MIVSGWMAWIARTHYHYTQHCLMRRHQSLFCTVKSSVGSPAAPERFLQMLLMIISLHRKHDNWHTNTRNRKTWVISYQEHPSSLLTAFLCCVRSANKVLGHTHPHTYKHKHTVWEDEFNGSSSLDLENVSLNRKGELQKNLYSCALEHLNTHTHTNSSKLQILA